MKKFFWALMLAFAAVSFVACEEEQPVDDNNKEQTEVCDKCGQDPCVCEEEPGDEPGNETPAGPDWCDYLIDKQFECTVASDYYVGSFDFTTDLTTDGKTLMEVLGYATWAEVVDAIDADEVAYFGYNFNTESDMLDESTTNGYGFWLDASGNVDAWANETSRFYSEGEWVQDDSGEWYCKGIAVGIYPGRIEAGDVFKSAMVFQKVDGDNVLRVGLQFTIYVIAFVDPEAASYNAANRVVGESTINLTGSLSMANDDHASFTGITLPLDELQAKLQLTKYQFNEIFLAGATYNESTGELYAGIDVTNYVNGEVADNNAGGIAGNWLSGTGALSSFGAADCVLCLEMQSAATALQTHVCIYPDQLNGPHDVLGEDGNPTGETYGGTAVNNAIGSTINYTQVVTYIPSDEYGVATGEASVVTINYAVTITE